MRWFPRPGRPPAPAALEPAVPLFIADSRVLLAVLDEAVSVLDSAEVLLECCEGGTVTVAEARAGLRLRTKFAQLGDWLGELHCGPEHAAAQEEAGTLLAFYLQMLTHSVEACFSPTAAGRVTIRSHGPRGGGGGGPAERLRRLRDGVREALGESAG